MTMSPAAHAVLRRLAVDATTARVLRGFEEAGIRSILLKGPTLQEALYRDGSFRPYIDTDLLISPADLPRTATALEALGFELELDHRDHAAISEPHAQEWGATDVPTKVDLHWRVPGIEAAPERAWEILAAETEPLTIAAVRGERLRLPAIALLVALHAAHHGRTVQRPIEDLERALAQLEPGTWIEAARLAASLGATEALAAGLRLVPAGQRLAEELALPAVSSPSRRLLAADQQPGSLGVLRVLDAPGAGGRVRAVRDALFPAPELIRRSFPLARRGRGGLALAYVVRAAVRGWQLPGAIRAARSARRR
jgi:hypothetical protein